MDDNDLRDAVRRGYLVLATHGLRGLTVDRSLVRFDPSMPPDLRAAVLAWALEEKAPSTVS